LNTNYKVGDKVRIKKLTPLRAKFKDAIIIRWEIYNKKILYSVEFSDGHKNKYNDDKFYNLNQRRKEIFNRLIN